MRDQDRGRADPAAGQGGAPEVPCDEKVFFESFYRATVRGEPADWMTIGATTEHESRFHYNAVENSIIRAVARIEPPPRGAAIGAWRTLKRRRGARLLDVGSGTGHWIDFFRDALFVTEAYGFEIAEAMAAHLRRKYADRPEVRILSIDVVEGDLAAAVGAPVDYVSAVGVMFHIVEDPDWEKAVANLSAAMAAGGLMFVGGDFGAETRNVQFHAVDAFGSWREHDLARASAVERRVNKRVRSLAAWADLAARCGLEVADLVRSDRDPLIMTPENDVLVLRRKA